MAVQAQCAELSKWPTYNGKDSINWLWFGSFWNVRLTYRVHYSWWTGRITVLTDDKFRLIIQEVNKTQLKLGVSAIHLLHSQKVHVHWKQWSEPPEKQTYKNGSTFFSPLGQYSKKSQYRKALASVEFRMGGKKKKCSIVYPFAAETRASNATSLHHLNRFHRHVGVI